MLMLVLFHAFMGMRIVVADYSQRRRPRRADDRACTSWRALLLVMGTVVVMTLPERRPERAMTRR